VQNGQPSPVFSSVYNVSLSRITENEKGFFLSLSNRRREAAVSAGRGACRLFLKAMGGQGKNIIRSAQSPP